MRAIVIEHVPVSDLPVAWQEKLSPDTGARVTVRIEAETAAETRVAPEDPEDPLFGMWRDRNDMADVAGYVRRIRAPRFNSDGTRNEP